MNIKTIGIMSAALALALAVPVVGTISNVYVKASNESKIATVSPDEEQEVIQKDLVAVPDGPNVYYNTLPTIKSGPYNYSDVENKTIVLRYKSNNAIEGFKKMKMNVDEYESDGVTPKTVTYTAEVACVERSHTPYSVYALDDNQIDYIDNLRDNLTPEECEAAFIDGGRLENDFLDRGETPNPKNCTVTLSSEALDFELFRDEVIYTEVTYSINGEEEETVYAFVNLRRDKENHTKGYKSASVDVYANVGDVIDYKIKLPLKDGDVYQCFKSTVVE